MIIDHESQSRNSGAGTWRMVINSDNECVIQVYVDRAWVTKHTVTV